MNKEYHPIANIFPLMTGEEYEALKADIASNGLLEPIWLHPDGRIIDGRNRYRACMAVGAEAKFRTWEGDGSLVTFVVSLNLHRRHLTSSQRGALAVDILPMLEAEAKERKAEAGRSAAPGKPAEKDVEIIPHLSPLAFDDTGRARAQAAAILNTNERYVSDAKRIAEEAPEVFEMVREGTVNMPAAKQLAGLDANKRASVLSDLRERGVDDVGGREVRQSLRTVSQQEKKQPPPLPSNKYRVWYADPPWAYGNSGVIGDSDNYGRAERHYPTMSIDELCQMGPEIKDACEDDAVLFLWVTSPLLEECFPVIRAWGFKYKTSFVWDKVGHNYGHYNSVRHELLLICTKGSCTPDNKTLYDSVVSIEKSTIHSQKPEEFREMIDSLYTWGNRIELFSRSDANGWDRWGNE